MKIILLTILLIVGLSANEVTEVENKCNKNMYCVIAGHYYYDGKIVRQYYKKAADLYKKACDGNEMYGCSELGNLYANGEGVKKDRKQANKLYKKSCDGGNPFGCYFLGKSYYSGLEVKKNKKIAKELFGKACDGGFTQGCDDYKYMNMHKEGI